MKSLLWSGVALLLVACNPWAKSDSDSGRSAPAVDSAIEVDLTKLSATAANESAYVLQAEIVCADGNHVVDLTEQNQKSVIYRNLRDCRIDLKKFVVEIDGESLTYAVTPRQSHGFAVFDASADGQVVDTKLATGSVTYSDLCGQDEDCDYEKVKVKYKYSELLSERITLENNLAVSKLEFAIEKEPAPSCTVTPHFEQSGFGEPELVIDFADCVDLFDHEILEYSIGMHLDGTVYGIEGLHASITAANQSFDAGVAHQIRLTVADLLAISGGNDIFAALSMDLVIATRNRDGMSIKYYVIDNDCEPIVGGVNPPLGGCETAFAYGSQTFVELDLGNNRWGWQVAVASGESKTTPLYAGAGQNNIESGTQVGVLRYQYDGATLVVSYELEPEYGLKKTHLYAGLTNITTTAPGQFGHQHDDLEGAQTDSYSIPLVGSAIKVVAHAEVCDAE